jgi:hypothetical protein
MRAVALLFASVVLALALGACGDDEESPPERPQESAETGTATAETVAEDAERPLDRNPCKLLGRDRIRDLFGENVKGRFEEGDDANVCGYRSSRPADPAATPPVPSGIDVFLGVEYFVGLSRELATQSAVYPVRGVPGVGDSAYVAGNKAGAVVGDGGVMIVTLGLDPSEPAVEDLLVDLLTEAVAAY